jgi:hypothetical protein
MFLILNIDACKGNPIEINLLTIKKYLSLSVLDTFFHSVLEKMEFTTSNSSIVITKIKKDI